MKSMLLQLAYNETSEGTLGPFNVEAKLTSVGGSVLYATGAGRVRLTSSLCIPAVIAHILMLLFVSWFQAI